MTRMEDRKTDNKIIINKNLRFSIWDDGALTIDHLGTDTGFIIDKIDVSKIRELLAENKNLNLTNEEIKKIRAEYSKKTCPFLKSKCITAECVFWKEYFIVDTPNVYCVILQHVSR